MQINAENGQKVALFGLSRADFLGGASEAFYEDAVEV